VAEENMLLDEVRGDAALSEIAARHKRSPGAITSRLGKLLTPQQKFAGGEDLFSWARSEIRQGPAGPLGWAWERAVAGVTAGHPGPPRSAASRHGRRRTAPATPGRRAEVLAIWSSITGLGACDAAAVELSAAAELEVLATVDDARLRAAGVAVLATTGDLVPASWVLEADWPGIERLSVTVEQLREGSEDVAQAGADLLVAGLARAKERDREIMQMRLGLPGEAMTLAEIADRYWLSRERIRQIQANVIKHARVRGQAKVRRCWHQVHDTLRAALSDAPDQPGLDPDLVLSFIELATPLAPRGVAIALVASLCGLTNDVTEVLTSAVEERHEHRVRLRQQQALAEKYRQVTAAKIRRLIALADWPDSSAEPDRCSVSPQREPLDHGLRCKPSRWMSPLLGREVGADSDAELQMFQLLDAAEDVITYCEQPVRIPYRFYGRQHMYFPDVLVDFRDGRRLLIEVKASIDEFAVDRNVAKFEAAAQYCRAKGWGFVAVTHRLQTADDLLRRHVDDHAADAVRAHLAAGPTNRVDLDPVMREHQLGRTDIATLALRYGWYWNPSPFRLSAQPLCEIAELIGHYTALSLDAPGHRRGSCPFCGSTAFIVRPDYGTFHCYRCGPGGGTAEFLRQAAAL
jgi:hypothetical protein